MAAGHIMWRYNRHIIRRRHTRNPNIYYIDPWGQYNSSWDYSGGLLDYRRPIAQWATVNRRFTRLRRVANWRLWRRDQEGSRLLAAAAL